MSVAIDDSAVESVRRPEMRRKDREILGREGLAAVLDEADACSIAFAVGDEPYIVKLNFGYDWEGALPFLYFHCAREGRKLVLMRANPRVCFALDAGHELTKGPGPCDWGMKYASIVGYGLLSEVDGDAERRSALDRVMRHYSWSGEGVYHEGTLGSTSVLKLAVSEMSGKRRA
jgi:nitroimidazol reductase NimA-like FMN-containing flavoprotein (pyridoxamine 5'-phosphate oxidase superfamily)